MAFLRISLLLMGTLLMLMTAASGQLSQPTSQGAELWLENQTQATSRFHRTLHNQATGRMVNLPTGQYRRGIIGWSQDGQWLLYYDNAECGHGGCIPYGGVWRFHATGRDQTKIGETTFGDEELTRSQTGRWYSTINAENEIVLHREDGRDTRILAQVPGAVQEKWLSYWSPHDEWLYVVLGFWSRTYSTDTPTVAIYRIRPTSTDLEPVVILDDRIGDAFYVSDEWITFSVSDAKEENYWIYRARPDGSDLEQIYSGGVEVSEDLLWTAPSGKVFSYDRFAGGEVVGYNVETGERRSIVRNNVNATLYLSNPVFPSNPYGQFRLQRSNSGQFMMGKFVDISEHDYWVVLAETGEVILNYPLTNEGVVHFDFWSGEIAYMVTESDDSQFHLYSYHIGDQALSVARTFPEGATDVRLIETQQHYWFMYGLDGIQYVTNLDGTENFRVRPDMEYYSDIESVEIPLPDQNSRLSGIVGLGMMIFAFGLGWIRRRTV